MEKPPTGLPGEARASERSRDKLLVSYTISADIPAEYTETYDIAVGGLAMLTNTQLSVDLKIIIELELHGDVRPNLRVNGNVRWSTYDPLLNKYRTGIEFRNREPDFEHKLLRYIDTLHDLRAR